MTTAPSTARLRRILGVVTTLALTASTLAFGLASETGAVTNRPNATLSPLGLSVTSEQTLAPTSSRTGEAMLFAVEEADEGHDLNGDGDGDDIVLHVFEPGGLGSFGRNLGLALAPEQVLRRGEEVVAFVVDEAAQSADLNGDGDTDDQVLHVWDDRAGEALSSGLALSTDGYPYPYWPLGTAGVTGVVGEAAQSADLNGDGDTDDQVLHVWVARRALTVSTGRAYATSGTFRMSGLPAHQPLAEGQLALLVDEAADGRDADGDGDTVGNVLHLLDIETGTLRSLGVVAHALHDGGPGLVLLEADEADTSRDLDGDGVVGGTPLLVSDGTVAGTVATGVEASPFLDTMDRRVAPAGAGVVAIVPRDDAPGPDAVQRFDVASGTLAATGAYTSQLVPVADGHVAFIDPTAPDTSPEPTDPAPTLSVLRPDGTVLDTGIEGSGIRALGDGTAAVVEQAAFFGTPRLAALFDVTTGDHWFPDLDLQVHGALPLADGRVATRAVEHADGPFHAMLDGDATPDEALPAVWDLVAGTTRTLDVGTLASWPTRGGGVLLAVDEAVVGDGNGDGDAVDTVLVHADLGARGAQTGPGWQLDATVVGDGQVRVTATSDSDDATPLVAAGARVDGGARSALTPTDGVYDTATETFDVTLAGADGSTVCIDGLDADGDRSLACVDVDVVVPDAEGPVVRDLTAGPDPVHPGDPVRVDVVVDDDATGGSAIAGATLRLDGVSTPLEPTAAPSDGAIEPYGATVDAPTTAGTYELCVTGSDAAGNTSVPTCTTLVARDLQAPSVTALGAAPDPVEEGEPVVLHATIDDTDTGGSRIADATLRLDGTALPTTARDGALDSPTEQVEAFLDHAAGVGEHELCVTATDVAGAAVDACTTVVVEAGVGPLVRDVVVSPRRVGLSTGTTLTAVIDDSTTGNAFVAGASWTVDGETGGAMSTNDFDEPVESVTAEVGGFATPGDRQLCVTGRDRNGNTSTEPGCVTLTVVDDVAPVVVEVDVPATVQLRAPFDVVATADDSTAGGSVVSSMEVTVDGGPPVALDASDGAFDSAVERAGGTLGALDTVGTHRLCVRATDAAGTTSGASCTSFVVSDTLAPQLAGLTLPDEVVAGEPFTFSFTADDSATGGARIVATAATVAGGAGIASAAPADGRYDAPTETITGEVARTTSAGVLQVCVHATDEHGNHAEPLCDTVTVVGRTVTGAGSIPSALGPLADDATFDLDVRETPDGLQGHLTHTDGPYGFAATEFTALRTVGSTTGHVEGRGTLSGGITCDFSAIAREGTADGGSPGGWSLRLANCQQVLGSLYDSGPVRTLVTGEVVVRGG